MRGRCGRVIEYQSISEEASKDKCCSQKAKGSQVDASNDHLDAGQPGTKRRRGLKVKAVCIICVVGAGEAHKEGACPPQKKKKEEAAWPGQATNED